MASSTPPDHINSLPTELLVAVLITFPTRELLISQRVCKAWRELITKTKELQQALFLLPQDLKWRWKYKSERATASRQKPGPGRVQFQGPSRKETFRMTRVRPTARGSIIETPCVREFTYGFNPANNNTISPYRHEAVVARLNPLILKAARHEPGIVENLRAGGYVFARLAISDFLHDQHPEASWRKMYICQPPIRAISFDRFFDRPWFPFDTQNGTNETVYAQCGMVTNNPRGITINDLFHDIQNDAQQIETWLSKEVSDHGWNKEELPSIKAQFHWDCSIQLYGAVSPNEEQIARLVEASGQIFEAGGDEPPEPDWSSASSE